MFKNIHGVLFAREDFESHIEIESNVGVLSSVVLKNSFPDVNYEMLQQLMVYSEFCKRIDDEETLMLIENGTSNPNEEEEEMDQSSNHSQGLHTKLTATDGDDQIINADYFFFPGLVKETKERLHIWKNSENYSYKSGWCLECNKDTFLNSLFLQVLLLRLMFQFATTSKPDSKLHRECKIWKNGLFWSMQGCLLYTSPSPRDATLSRMPSSA